jgi:hypothetical protein
MHRIWSDGRWNKLTIANNDVAFSDPQNVDHDLLGVGLKKALYNYMHGLGYEQPMQFWFDDKTNQKKRGQILS